MSNTLSLNNKTFADTFINYITHNTNTFEGRPEFSEKIKEILREAGELKIGRTILQELIDSGKTIKILEDKESWLDVKNNTIFLTFEKIFYPYKKGCKRKLQELPLVSTLLHEMVHFKHWRNDANAMEKRLHTVSINPEMDNREEELTITGKINGEDEVEPCNDNAILDELKLPSKIDHLGMTHKKSLLENLQGMIHTRALGCLRKKLDSSEGKIELISSSEKLLLTAISALLNYDSASNLAEHVSIISLLVNLGCKSNEALENLLRVDLSEQTLIRFLNFEKQTDACSRVSLSKKGRLDLIMQKEYLGMIKQLIHVGCKSDDSLEFAVKLIKKIPSPNLRSEYLQIVSQLIVSGCKSDVALKVSLRKADGINVATLYKDYFEIIHQLIDAKSASDAQLNSALEISAGYAAKEKDHAKQKEWIGIVDKLIKLEYRPTSCSMNFVSLIKSIKDPTSAIKYYKLVQPFIQEKLDEIESQMKSEFCMYMQNLISADYTSNGLKLFKVTRQFALDAERMDKHEIELQSELDLIHSYIDANYSIEDISLKINEKCAQLSFIEKFSFIDSLIHSTLYIAISGKNFCKSLTPEFQLPQFEKIKEGCASIIRSRQAKEEQSKTTGINTTAILTSLCVLKLKFGVTQ